MNDKNLKDIWKTTEVNAKPEGYESSTIERFVKGRSGSVADQIRKMLQFDVALKTLAVILLIIDITLYLNTEMVVIISICGITVLTALAMFEIKVLQRFSRIADNNQSTKENLSEMLIFLRSRFFTALLSIASTYIFIFISGSLIYFYAVYGEVRKLDGTDILVFSTFILIGIVLNFVVNFGQVKYHIKHLESCLANLNDNLLEIISQNITTQQKQDRKIKMLFGVLLIFGFVLLILVLKKIGM